MEYITDLQKNVQEAFEKVQKNADKARQKQKSVYDLKAKAAKLEIGDRVLVKILAFDGKHKIADKWTKDIYIYCNRYTKFKYSSVQSRKRGW